MSCGWGRISRRLGDRRSRAVHRVARIHGGGRGRHVGLLRHAAEDLLRALERVPGFTEARLLLVLVDGGTMVSDPSAATTLAPRLTDSEGALKRAIVDRRIAGGRAIGLPQTTETRLARRLATDRPARTMYS